ncbi:hypothetical protein ACWCV2_33800, partial [Streptomyces pseudogriseolus]
MTERPSSALRRFVEEDDPNGLTLVVDTPQGTHLRRIPPALPCPLTSITEPARKRQPTRPQQPGACPTSSSSRQPTRPRARAGATSFHNAAGADLVVYNSEWIRRDGEIFYARY